LTNEPSEPTPLMRVVDTLDDEVYWLAGSDEAEVARVFGTTGIEITHGVWTPAKQEV
jgi:hypothetical protein